MATTTIPKTPAKVNYLNNRDILKEIHLSKNTYCTYRDPVLDHQYDIILPTVLKINQRTVAEARRNRADRIKRETGQTVDPVKIPNTDLVFRIVCWEHIPMAAKKVPKSQAKKKKIEHLEFGVIDFNKKYNVLIVDNNEINQLLLMKILINHGGFFIDIAENGKHALEQIKNNEYDLILMDIDMPVMDGIQASILIKSHEDKNISRIPIIALSANPTDHEKKNCKEVGIKEYLPRPHTREELFTAIYKALKIKKALKF